MSIYFSIIVPNYNNEKFLQRCIQSVVKQSFENWELLIIDNNSEDSSKEIINSFKDNRIRVIDVNNKGIIAKSRNLGIKVSQSEWLCFLDSDDWWEINKLEIIYENIKKKNTDVIVHNELLVFENKNKVKKLIYGPFEKNFFEKLLFFGNRISVSASAVKKDFILRNKINFSEKEEHITAEDYDFWLKISEKKGKFEFLDNILGNYFIHSKNYSKNLEKHFDNVFNVCEDHSKLYKKNKYIKFILARKHLLLAFRNLKSFKFFIYLYLSIKSSAFFILIFIYNKIKIKFLK